MFARLILATAVTSAVMVVAHAETITTYSEGTIYYGYDRTGIFGPVNADLAGKPYSETITIDRNPSNDHVSSPFAHNYGSALGTVTTSVGGKSFSTQLTRSDSDPNVLPLVDALVANNLSLHPQLGHGYEDQLEGKVEGRNSTQRVITDQYTASILQSFVGAVADLGMSYSHKTTGSDIALASYDFSDSRGETFFSANPTLFVFNPSPAATPQITEYDFTGKCRDCNQTGSRIGKPSKSELFLQNYQAGTPINSSNFVSFHYDGTDLLGAYDVLPTDLSLISGALPTVAGPSDFEIKFSGANANFFRTALSGEWSTGKTISADEGSEASFSAVPEPTSVALIGLGLLSFAASRRKSAKNKSV